MNSIAGTGGRFTLLCIGAALILGLVNALTAPVAKAREVREFREILTTLVRDGLIGTAQKTEKVPGVTAFYPVRDKSGKTTSVIVELQGEGYGGSFSIAAAYKRNGEILSARLLQNKETPGMGKMAESSAYMKKFIGTGGEKPVPRKKAQLGAEEAHAVSGATVTFFGVAQALERGSKYVQGLGDLK